MFDFMIVHNIYSASVHMSTVCVRSVSGCVICVRVVPAACDIRWRIILMLNASYVYLYIQAHVGDFWRSINHNVHRLYFFAGEPSLACVPWT